MRLLDTLRRTVGVGCCVCLALHAWSAPADAAIEWRAGVRDELPRMNIAEMGYALTQNPGASHVIVQFEAPVTAPQRRALAKAGITLQTWLGDNAFFARVGEDFRGARDLKAVKGLKAIAEIRPEHKMHRMFVNREIPDWAVVGAEHHPAGESSYTIGAYVLFHPDVDASTEGWRICKEHDADFVSEIRSLNGLVIELPYDNIARLASDDAVQWIEPPLPKMDVNNDSNRAITEVETVQAAPYGLDGSGVTVLVYDGGTADSSHADFGGRLTEYDSSGVHYHSTHVAGTIGGDGTSSGGQYRGMAPGVTLVSYGFEQEGGLQEGFLYTDPGDLEADYDAAINTHGAEISNNSIGSNTAPNGFPCEWEGDYGVTAALIDAIVGGSLGDPFRIVWSNGNERGSGRCGTTYLTTAPPACAKNHITVGALNSNDDSVTDFTSWGPTDDGRIKPDVSGPGCQSDGDYGVTSCDSGGGYTSLCGTSMSGPTVCGVSALIMQEWRTLHPGEGDFRNSTLKSILAHTAQDVENLGPDYKTGYGSVRAKAAIDFIRLDQVIEAEVAQGGAHSVLVHVEPGATELKVTIAWDDPPGTPNVNPNLVNDLDLQVFGPGDVRHYPWTLDPANGDTPAVRTQEDHANNIEQVFVENPTPGVWRVDVVGYNVPSGPQVVSLAASPSLVNCSSRGYVALDSSVYACADTAEVRVNDCDLNTDDEVAETVQITIASDSEPAGEVLTLTETGGPTADFRATIQLAASGGAGVLVIGEGDVITATYIDADDGEGGVNVTRTATSNVDCTPPVIYNVQVVDVGPREATVTFQTDEPTTGSVHYGLICGAPTDVAASSGRSTDHSLNIRGLDTDTLYRFHVEAEDEAGNASSNDNAGQCFQIQTPEVPDFFTEEFGSGFDMDGWSMLLTPNGSNDFYDSCIAPIAALPVDPAGGVALTLSDDDYAAVSPSLGVQFYGTAHHTFYVGSNGYITFGQGDSDYSESLSEHFAIPRIAALYDDLNPNNGGTVSWKETGDCVVTTWEGVPEYSATGSNTFQIEQFFNGAIRISWLGVSSSDSIVGLSEGVGLSPDYIDTPLSDQSECGESCPWDISNPADGVVGLGDLNALLSNWGPCPAPPAECPWDFSDPADGVVGLGDLNAMLSNWGPCP